MKNILLLFFLLALCFNLQAQRPDPNRQKLLVFQDSLKALGLNIVNNPAEPERYNSNYKFIKTLIEALKIPGSLNFSFDSLKTISIQPSGDGVFRIFSWNVMNNDGSYRYYGTIQMRSPDGKLKMFPLVDYSPFIKAPEDTVTTNDNWYAAQYYKVIPVTRNVQVPYYVLLGWKGNTVKSTKKVIDILYFKGGKACFGMPVFDGDKEHPKKKRIIFEYARQVSMMLDYQPKEGLIVFDHLAPPDPRMKGIFNTYGPDLSYDGLKLVNGRWQLVQDLDLKNAASEADELYNDPRKPPAAKPR